MTCSKRDRHMAAKRDSFTTLPAKKNQHSRVDTRRWPKRWIYTTELSNARIQLRAFECRLLNILATDQLANRRRSYCVQPIFIRSNFANYYHKHKLCDTYSCILPIHITGWRCRYRQWHWTHPFSGKALVRSIFSIGRILHLYKHKPSNFCMAAQAFAFRLASEVLVTTSRKSKRIIAANQTSISILF